MRGPSVKPKVKLSKLVDKVSKSYRALTPADSINFFRPRRCVLAKTNKPHLTKILFSSNNGTMSATVANATKSSSHFSWPKKVEPFLEGSTFLRAQCNLKAKPVPQRPLNG